MAQHARACLLDPHTAEPAEQLNSHTWLSAVEALECFWLKAWMPKGPGLLEFEMEGGLHAHTVTQAIRSIRCKASLGGLRGTDSQRSRPLSIIKDIIKK